MEVKLSTIQTIESTDVGEKKPYREPIGCLMYLMLGTRPDISVSVNYHSRFQEKPTEEHWRGLKRIFRYLKATTDMYIHFSLN